MCKFDSSYLVLCYTRFSPLTIEIISLIISIIGELISCFNINNIEFLNEENIDKILFLANIFYFAIIIIFNIIIIFFRYYDLINNELNLWGYGLSFIAIIISFCGIVTNILDDLIIITNIKNCSSLLAIIILISIIFTIWWNLFLMAVTDNWLINNKIKGSYHEYELALKEEKKFTDIQNKKNESTTSNDNKDSKEIKIKNKINIKNNDIIKKIDIINSVNASLKDNNNLNVKLKSNEEK